jgi:hypothetical protein
MCFGKFLRLLTILFTATMSLHASVHTGIGMASSPPYQDTATHIDFSAMQDSCTLKPGLCPWPIQDIWIKGNTLYSLYGIVPDTLLGQAAVKLFQEKGVMISNPGVITSLYDSLFNTQCVVAPTRGWMKSARIQCGAYYMKTSEGQYASLVIFDQYIGGIDRYYFYWAYQDNGFRWLYKGAGSISMWDSVIVRPHIFSGRPDPVFVICDSVNVQSIRQAIDSLTVMIMQNGITLPGGHFWWPGIGITYCEPVYSSRMYLPFETGKDSIACQMYDPISSQPVPANARVMADKDNSFQQLIIDILIREDPVSIIGTDTIEAAPLMKYFFPPPVGILPYIQGSTSKHLAGNAVRYVPEHRVLEFRLCSPEYISVAVFDCRGRMITALHNRLVDAGQTQLSLPRTISMSGVGFLRVQIGGQSSAAAVLLLH